MTHTKYISMKRCINCWHIMGAEVKTCTQCNYLLVSEATEEEKVKAIKRLDELKERADLN